MQVHHHRGVIINALSQNEWETVQLTAFWLPSARHVCSYVPWSFSAVQHAAVLCLAAHLHRQLLYACPVVLLHPPQHLQLSPLHINLQQVNTPAAAPASNASSSSNGSKFRILRCSSVAS
jgi:hypothetical protein